jgi:uncharacterized protein
MLSALSRVAADAGEAALERLAPSSPAVAQAQTLAETGHRPWPLPRRPWLMGQTWRDLLLAHWRVPIEELRRVVPDVVPLDTFDGAAWLGVTPFEVTDLRLRGMPPVPPLSCFPETNVRTYATVGGKPGIWFLSLDAASRLAVTGARRTYRLPYFHAAMAIERDGERIDYRTRRVSPDGPPAELEATYEPAGTPFEAQPGTLAHFLAERYCLYALDERRRILRADIHHPPWPLQPARATFARDTMAAPLGIPLPDRAPLLHYARRQDVAIWSPERVDGE